MVADTFFCLHYVGFMIARELPNSKYAMARPGPASHFYW